MDVRRRSPAVRFGERALELEVSDDGRGMSPDADGGAMGSSGCAQRVALYRGTRDVQPGAGSGFAVRASLPIATS